MSATEIVDNSESALSITSEERDVATSNVQDDRGEMEETLEKKLNGVLETNDIVALGGATPENGVTETQQHAKAEDEILLDLKDSTHESQADVLSKSTEDSSGAVVAPTSDSDVESDINAVSIKSDEAKVEELAHVPISESLNETADGVVTTSEGPDESLVQVVAPEQPEEPEPLAQFIDSSGETAPESEVSEVVEDVQDASPEHATDTVEATLEAVTEPKDEEMTASESIILEETFAAAESKDDIPVSESAPVEETSAAVVAEPTEEETTAAVVAEPAEEETPAAVVAEPAEEETPAAVVAEPTGEETPAAVVADPTEEETSAAIVAEPKDEETAAVVAEPTEEETSVAVVAEPKEEETSASVVAEPTEETSAAIVAAPNDEEAAAAVAKPTEEETSVVAEPTEEETSAAIVAAPNDEEAAAAVAEPTEEETSVVTEPTEETSAAIVAAPNDEEAAVAVAETKEEEAPAVVVAEPTEEETAAAVVTEPTEEETAVVVVAEPTEEETPAVIAELKEEETPAVVVLEPTEEETTVVVAEPTEEETAVAVVAEPTEEETPAAAVAEPTEEETAVVVAEPTEEETAVAVVAEPTEEETPVIAELKEEEAPAAVVAEPTEEETAAVVAEPKEEETAAVVVEPKEDETVAVVTAVAEPIEEEITAAVVAEPAEEETPAVIAEPKDEDTSAAVIMEPEDEEMSILESAAEIPAAVEIELAESAPAVDNSKAENPAADEAASSTDAEGLAEASQTLAKEESSPDAAETSAIIEAEDIAPKSTSSTVLEDEDNGPSEGVVAVAADGASVEVGEHTLSTAENSSLESQDAEPDPASIASAAETLEEGVESLNETDSIVNEPAVDQEDVSTKPVSMDEGLSHNIPEVSESAPDTVALEAVGNADEPDTAPIVVAEGASFEASEPTAEDGAVTPVSVDAEPETGAESLKKEESNEANSEPVLEKVEAGIAPSVLDTLESTTEPSASSERNANLHDQVLDTSVSVSETVEDNISRGSVDVKPIIQDVNDTVDLTNHESKTVTDASDTVGLAVDAAGIDRPKSPWTPSYSVTNQGPSIPAEQEIPEIEELPPADTNVVSRSEVESQIPVLNVPTSAEEVVTSGPTEQAPSADPVSSRPSSPWVPSYSVSVQGSPSPSKAGSPVAAPVDLPADEINEEVKQSPAQSEIVVESTQLDIQPASDIDIVEPVPAPVEDEPPIEQSISEPEVVSAQTFEVPEEEHSVEEQQQVSVVEHSDDIIMDDEVKIVDDGVPEQTKDSHEHETNVYEPSGAALVADASDVSTAEGENVVDPEPAADHTQSLLVDSSSIEIERPKSPWGSYEVTTQHGPTSDEQTIPISESAEDEDIAPKSFIQEATVEHTVPVEENTPSEQVDLAAGTTEEVETVLDSSRLTVDTTTDDVPERPKSPWTPSYSVTRQGSGVFEDTKDDAALDTLEKLPPRAASPGTADVPIEDQVEEHVAVTEASPAVEPVSELKPEEAGPAKVDSDIPPPKITTQVFPSGHDREGSQQSLTSLDTVDNSAAKNRKRLESTASSLFFPGGWFSKVPAGRTSLDNAQGEFTPSKPSSPVAATPSQATETSEDADASATDDKEKKSKWCVIM